MSEQAEEGLSPCRSVQQVRRVKRSHGFPTEYSGVCVHIYEGSSFVHPHSAAAVTRPVVYLILGTDAYPGHPGAERHPGSSTWDFNAHCDLPYYNGRLRFLLVDVAGPQPVQIGCQDVNVTKEAFRQRAWEGQLTLLGPSGPCGTLHVAVNKTQGLIGVPRIIQLPQLSTGLSTTTGDAGVDFAHSIDSEDEVAFATRSAVDTPHRSVHIHLHRLDGFPADATPYVLGTVGKEKVRSGTRFDLGDRIQFDEVLIFPYKCTRYLKLSVKDSQDSKLGTVTVDLDRYLDSHEPTKVVLPLRSKGEQRGNILATIAWSDCEEQKGRLISEVESASTEKSSESSRCSVAEEILEKVSALRVHLLELDDLDIKEPLNIFISGKLGGEHLRTQTLDSVASAKCSINHSFVWPFYKQRYVKFTAKSDEVRRHGRRLGAGVINVEPIFEGRTIGTREMTCALKDRDGVTFGILRLVVEPVRHVSVERPFVELSSIPPYPTHDGENGQIKSIIAEVVSLEADHDGGAFDPPNPYVVCQYGPKKHTGKVYKTAGFVCEMSDRFAFSASGKYCHHYKLKFDVFDKNLQKDFVLGTGTLNIARDPISQQPFKVKLINTRGQACGCLNVQLTTTMSAENLTPPAVPSEGPAAVASAEEPDEIDGRLNVPSEIRAKEPGSVALKVIRITNAVVNGGKSKTDWIDPCTVVSFHQDKLRTTAVYQRHGEWCCFPYRPLKYMKIEACGQVHNVTLGSALITLDKYINKDTQKLKVPLVARDGSTRVGVAYINLKFSPESISKAHVQPLPNKLDESVLLPTTSESSDEEVVFRHKAFHLTGLTLFLDKSDEKPVSPYIRTKYGHSKLKTIPMHRPVKNSEWKRGVIYPDKHSYSTNEYASCRFTVRDAHDFHWNHRLGTASINVHELEDRVPGGRARPFVVVLKDDHGQAVGELSGSVSFDNTEVPNGAEKPQPPGEELESREPEMSNMISQVTTTAKAFSVRLRHVDWLFLRGNKGPFPPESGSGIRPYAVAKFGAAKLRGHTRDQTGPICLIGEVMHFPYQPFEGVHFRIKDDRRLRFNPVMGEGNLSLDELINKAGASEVILPLEWDRAIVGNLYLDVTVSNDAIDKACVVSFPCGLATSPLARRMSYMSSSSDEEKEPTPAVTTNNRSFKLELLDCQELPRPERVTPIAPFVVCSFAGTKLHTVLALSSAERGHQLGDILFIPYKPAKTFTLTVKDNLNLTTDPILGLGELNIDDLINGPVDNPVEIILHKKDSAPVGKLNARFTPLAGELQKAYVESPNRERPQESSAESEAKVTTTVEAKYPAFDLELIGGERRFPQGATFDPYVIAHYKRDKLQTTIAQNQPTHSWSFGDVMHFAYQNQHPLLELRLYDDKAANKLVATGSFNPDQFINRDNWNTFVVMSGSGGAYSGTLRIRFTRQTSRVAKPYVTRPEKLDGDSSDSSDSGAEDVVVFRNKAVHIANLKLLEINHAVLEPVLLSPCITTKYGHKRLRGALAKNETDLSTFYEKHSYALNKHSTLRIKVAQNRHCALYKKLGSAIVNLYQLESAGKLHSVFTAPLVDTKGQRIGEVAGSVSFGNEIVAEDHQLIPYSVAVYDGEPSTSEESQENSPISAYNSEVKTERLGFSLEVCRCEHLLGDATMSPFVVGQFGKRLLRSPAVASGGENPVFGHIFFFPYKPIRFLDFEVRDTNASKKNASLGLGQVDIDQYINGEGAEIAVPLSLRQNKQQAGRMLLRFTPISSPIASPYVISPLVVAPKSEVAAVPQGTDVPPKRSLFG